MKQRDYQGKPFYLTEADCPDAQIFILHGICEHGLRYANLAEFLATQNFTSAFLDHPGHGQYLNSSLNATKVIESYCNDDPVLSQAKKCLHYRNTEIAVNIQNEFKQSANELQLDEILKYQSDFLEFLFQEKIFKREIPLFIFGQSMGGLIAASLALQIQDKHRISGNIFLSPAFGPTATPPKSQKILFKLLNKIESHFLKSCKKACDQNTLFGKTILKSMLKANPTVDTSWAVNYISDLPEENQLFADDPMINGSVKLRFLHSILEEMVNIQKKAAKMPGPLFIAYGTNDKIVNAIDTDAFIETYKKANNHESCQFVRFDDFEPHELHRSSLKQKVFNEITLWIRKTINEA